jgi:DNA-binding CsgD family transcriptional regulator
MKNTSKKQNDPGSIFSDELARTVLNSLSAHIAILDENGVILETNMAWRAFAVKGGLPADYDDRGSNYLAICEATIGSDTADAHQVAAGIRSVIRDELEEFLYDYPCHSPDGPHWYYMRAIRMDGDGPIRVVISHEEITALKLTEEALRKSQEELIEQKQSLEETNIAMKVLLKQREEDKLELEKKVLNNVKDLVLPYVEKLKNPRLKPKDRTLVDIIDTHLQDIISPLLQRFANAKILLTPQEMQVAALVKDGKTSKEIADVLNVSETTVNFHRKNLRVKFGLTNQRTNLRSYLLSIS